MAAPQPPKYVDVTISDFAADEVGQFNHLGHWDDPADDPLGISRGAAQQRMNDLLVELAEIADGSAVLDVGCGFGGTLAAIDRSFSGVRATGLDVDGRQLALDRRILARPGNSLTWTQGDACALPFPGDSFDRVLSIEAMWHFRSRERFFSEVARVLRPGGRLAVVDILVSPDAAERMGRPRTELLRTLDGAFAPWPEPAWTLDDSRATAGRSGLVMDTVMDATEHTKPTYLDHGGAQDRPASAELAATEAVRTFVDMHLQNALSLLYLAFEMSASGR